MSHLTAIEVRIQNKKILEETLRELIYTETIPGMKLEFDGVVKDYYGNTTFAEFIIRRKQKYDFGFRLNSRAEYEFVSDSDAEGTQEFLAKLIPFYSKKLVIWELLNKGFEIESVVDNDGTTKIIAGKWQ